MKKQEQLDRQNLKQIFNSNFQAEIQKTRKPFPHFSLKKTTSHVVFLCSVLFFIGVISFSSLMYLFVSDVETPLSLSTNIKKERSIRQEIDGEKAAIKNILMDQGKDIDKLTTSGAIDSIPELAVAQNIYTNKTNWFRAFIGIDQILKQIVSANDILQTITIKSIRFEKSDSSVFIEGLRAYGNSDLSKNKEGSSISLATTIVDTFEQSLFYKDIKVEEYSRKQEIGSGTLHSEFFTPLHFKAFIQGTNETNAKDKKLTIDTELESVQSPTSKKP